MMFATPEETEAFGFALGGVLRAGDVVTLTGDLGAGKTTLTRGILRGLGHEGEVPSPSFAIVQPYEPPTVRLPIAHVDLYRIEEDGEVDELGLDDWLWDGALVVEWPQRLGAALLGRALGLVITADAQERRVLTASVPTAWEARWPPR
ncbi:MAG: tRNA (adenosine(37)-N6)-threonylcarbamoyltransferase complex ATPase subunit type 1 TsaE [Sphingobium sp.]